MQHRNEKNNQTLSFNVWTLKSVNSNFLLFIRFVLFRTYPIGFNAAFVDVNSKVDTAVAVLTIRDSDEGLAGEAKLSIVSGNDGNWFRLESGNNFGIIRVIKLEPIEIRRFYELIIEAKDNGMPSLSTQNYIKVDLIEFRKKSVRENSQLINILGQIILFLLLRISSISKMGQLGRMSKMN